MSANFRKEIVLLNSGQVDAGHVELFVLPGLRHLIAAFGDADLDSIFRSEFVAKLFERSVPTPETSESLNDILIERVNDFLNDNVGQEDDELPERRLTVLLLGVSALQLFVYNNWRTNSLKVGLHDLIPLVSERSQAYFRDQLVVDGLYICGNALCPEYLWIAEKLLLEDRFHVTNETVSWWRLRCLFIHQQVVDDLSPNLHERIAKNITSPFETLDKQLCLADETDLRIQLHLEASRIKIFYYDVAMAATYLNTAKKISGLEIDLTGVLGKRTRFQQKDVAQLVAKVTACESLRIDGLVAQTAASIDDVALPRNLALNDDVRLDKMALNDPSCSRAPHLNPTEQALHLGLCLLMKKNSPASELKDEELIQLVENVLAEPQSWFIQTMALCLRSQLEGNHRRTVERAMMQMQVLVDQYKLDNVGRTKYYLPLVYASCLPPFWVIETELAHLFRKLGAVNSALDIYLALDIWEDVIACYQALHRKEKAEALIRERLAVSETPLLWCHLGDATGEPEHYTRAWEASNHRLARAQKSLGLMHFQKKMYEECIPYFLVCVQVNAFQLDAWSCLAFAAMQTEDWVLAARAYRRCTNLDSENHEIWNNLANVYLKLKDKERAWRTLQEALRCSYEDWRIWENYLLTSVDCRAFSEVITAYNRILDLKGKHVDADILELVVGAVISGVDDHVGNSAALLRPSLSKLFGRITASITNDGHVWRLYTRLIASNDDAQETKTRVVQYLQRAHHCFSHGVNWEKDLSTCLTIFQVDKDLAQACLKLDETQSITHISSAKLALNGTLVRLKKFYEKIQMEPSAAIGAQLAALEGELVRLTESGNRNAN